uniref:Uncharacterized protein n=1 Tax=Glossina brevipalpis TaxID=37001 RepID=A0A1A9WZC8_9MUSC
MLDWCEIFVAHLKTSWETWKKYSFGFDKINESNLINGMLTYALHYTSRSDELFKRDNVVNVFNATNSTNINAICTECAIAKHSVYHQKSQTIIMLGEIIERALQPLDLVRYSNFREQQKRLQEFPRDDLKKVVDSIIDRGVQLIESDVNHVFFYKNPYNIQKPDETKKKPLLITEQTSSSWESSSEESEQQEEEGFDEQWIKIGDFDFVKAVHQLTAFVENWELTPATKFVVIAREYAEEIKPFGHRYFAKIHFSKPTPKCPNPLAVAKLYFHMNICSYLPPFYPIMITYKFEGFKTMYYAVGERKLSSTKFQRYLIDSILHMKLAFYAELWDCRNPLTPLEKRQHPKVLNADTTDKKVCMEMLSNLKEILNQNQGGPTKKINLWHETIATITLQNCS